MRKLLYFICFIGLTVCPLVIAAGENEFDKVCNYFLQLQRHPDVEKMTHLQRNDFVMGKLAKELPIASNARVAWEAISSAVSEQRYELYKSSAVSVLNKKWTCAAMQQWANRTGEFK